MRSGVAVAVETPRTPPPLALAFVPFGAGQFANEQKVKGAVFLGLEARVKSPLMPLGLFRNRSVSTANILGAIAVLCATINVVGGFLLAARDREAGGRSPAARPRIARRGRAGRAGAAAAGARARRHHHGRQRALGQAARLAAY